MTSTQEPKYKIENGKIVNRATGEAIPDDEPIFILRGRDVHAADLIMDYYSCCGDEQHADIVYLRVKQFREFARAYPERMHEPTSPD